MKINAVDNRSDFIRFVFYSIDRPSRKSCVKNILLAKLNDLITTQLSLGISQIAIV